MLLIGWFGALRPSELVAIRTQHIKTDNHGVIITIAPSTIDPEPKTVAIAAHPRSRWDPARHLATWISTLTTQAASSTDDQVLWAATTRSGELTQPLRPIAVRTLTDIIKRRAHTAGITQPDDNNRHLKFSNQSLRAGFITEANKRGLPASEVTRYSNTDTDLWGHRNLTTNMRLYKET